MTLPPARRHFQPRGSAPAFTLVEMLIAVTLTAMMVAVMVNSVMSSATFYQTHAGELDRTAAARQVLAVVTRDLETAVLRDTPDVWLAVNPLTDVGNSGRWVPGGKPASWPLVLQPTRHEADNTKALLDYRFGVGGMWLRFFSRPEDRQQVQKRNRAVAVPGDINAMAYQIVRCGTPLGNRQVDDERLRYQLFRSVVRSDYTFKQGYDITSYKAGKSSADIIGLPGELKTPHPDTAVSDVVIDLGFVFKEYNDAGSLVEAYPNRDESLSRMKDPLRYQLPRDGKPVSVDVYVRVLSPEGADRLASREQNLSPDQWWKLAEREGRLFRRTVPLNWGL